MVEISIHALRVEGDREYPELGIVFCDISIHALRVEGDFVKILWLIDDLISIHALRVEGDLRMSPFRGRRIDISIHALRVEGDPENNVSSGANKKFLSTPSGWRATVLGIGDFHRDAYFYPRPPGGGRHILSGDKN